MKLAQLQQQPSVVHTRLFVTNGKRKLVEKKLSKGRSVQEATLSNGRKGVLFTNLDATDIEKFGTHELEIMSVEVGLTTVHAPVYSKS